MISTKVLLLLIKQLRDLDLFPVIGAEIEFYLNPISPNLQENLEIIPEKGLNQFEVRITHQDDVVAVIDQIENTKDYLKEKLQADFSAKPYEDQPGSALHIHLHLENSKGENLYKKRVEKESLILLQSIAGLCASMQENMLIFAPDEQAYLRYDGKSMESPCKICWGGNNRSAAIRIPLSEKDNRRLEYRVACAGSDPMQVIIAILFGVIKGINEELKAPEKLYGNAFQEQYDFPELTQSYEEALQAFDKSELMSMYQSTIASKE